jgi:outer membrane protein assembly factor BamD
MARQGHIWRRLRRLGPAGAVALLCLVAACSSDDDIVYEERPVDELYNEAMDAMQAGNFQGASRLFDEVERQHPYSPWATKAQLMAAYGFYRGQQYDEAVAALDRFVQLHPANPDVPYAHYLKGLCYYEQISDVSRDQEMTEQARQSFEELVSRYPDSQYSRDGRLKLDLIYDHLAGKDMAIGRYYLRQGHYLASINRFKTVIDRYQTTTHVPEALHRLVEAYAALGLNEEARKMAAVLGYNYPGSEWYVDSYDLVDDGSAVSSN